MLIISQKVGQTISAVDFRILGVMPSRPVVLATFKDLILDNSSSCFISGYVP